MTTERTEKPDQESSDAVVDSESDRFRASATNSSVDTEEGEPVDVEHAPPRLSQILSTSAALAGAGLTVPFALLAIPFGLSGVAMIAFSLFVVHSRGWLSVGTALILVGTIISGAYGALTPELMLVGVASTVIAWDLGQHGISIGEQLGRKTQSKRLQLVHTATSAVVIGLVSFIAYFVFLFSGDGRPGPAVALIVLGIVVMAWMFRS